MKRNRILATQTLSVSTQLAHITADVLLDIEGMAGIIAMQVELVDIFVCPYLYLSTFPLIYLFKYIYIYIYIYIYLYMYLNMYFFPPVATYIYIYMRVVCVSVYICIYNYVYVYISSILLLISV